LFNLLGNKWKCDALDTRQKSRSLSESLKGLTEFLKKPAHLLLDERRLSSLDFPAPNDGSKCALFNNVSISESKINL
jgi:hypothetical protein